jgi:hypothetical protein
MAWPALACWACCYSSSAGAERSAVAWYDPTTWEVFSDWGASDWSEDPDAAKVYAEDLIERTAEERGWTTTQLNDAYNFASQARTTAGAVGTEDPLSATLTFWSELASRFLLYPDGPAGWYELAETFDQALVTTETTAESRDEGTIGAVAEGTVANTDDDLAELWKTVRPWAIGIGALLALRELRGWTK